MSNCNSKLESDMRKYQPSDCKELTKCIPSGKGIAASRKHIGLYPGPEAVEEFKEELKGYSVDKGTVRIP